MQEIVNDKASMNLELSKYFSNDYLFEKKETTSHPYLEALHQQYLESSPEKDDVESFTIVIDNSGYPPN